VTAARPSRPPLLLLLAIGILSLALLWRVLGLNVPAAERICDDRYAAASTSSDTLAVDATEPDTMRPGLTCGAIRTGVR
jgi:hypothetical protein